MHSASSPGNRGNEDIQNLDNTVKYLYKSVTPKRKSTAMSTLMRFHFPLELSRFHTAFVKGMPFGACYRRMPQPVLTCASVVVQLVTSVDGELDESIRCC
jgi:hypothetical protein